MLLPLISALIIVVIGAILFWVIDKFVWNVTARQPSHNSRGSSNLSCRNPAAIVAGAWGGILGGRRPSIDSFHEFYFAEPGIQRLPRAHQIRPRLDADELHAGSLVRVYQVTVVFVADVGPEIIQQGFHDRHHFV